MTFVDTPGLVDGDMNYPFDVNQAMLWLGDLVDLIFVFFDPIGQVRISIQMHNWTFLSSFLLILATVFEKHFYKSYFRPCESGTRSKIDCSLCMKMFEIRLFL